MKISKKLLKLMDAVTDGAWYIIRSRGYEFRFRRQANSESMWDFKIGEDGFEHSVSELEECFGMIAVDQYDIGRRFARQEFKDFLEGKDVTACQM